MVEGYSNNSLIFYEWLCQVAIGFPLSTFNKRHKTLLIYEFVNVANENDFATFSHDYDI